MKLHRTRALLPLIAALGLATGCSNPVDTTENVLPYLSRVDTSPADVEEADADPLACGCLAPGQWFRFDTLGLLDLDGWEHPVVGILNALWSTDIGKGEINILLEVSEVTAETVTMNVVNGKQVDGTTEVCQDPASAASMVFPRQGCTLSATNETSFNVYAGTERYPKNCAVDLPVQHVIPVSRAVLSGQVSESCDVISDGQVPSGVLGQAAIGEICTCLLTPDQPTELCGDLDATYADGACDGCNAKYKSLTQLLVQLGGGDDLSWSCTTSEGGPATCLTATWSAVRMDATPAVCAQ